MEQTPDPPPANAHRRRHSHLVSAPTRSEDLAGFRRVEATVDESVSLTGLRGFLRDASALLALAEADEVVVLTHELVKNALALEEPEVRISVQRTANGGTRVEVRDHGYGLPTLAEGDTDGSALGLRIVDRIADRWGVDEFLPGKIVWFELQPPA